MKNILSKPILLFASLLTTTFSIAQSVNGGSDRRNSRNSNHSDRQRNVTYRDRTRNIELPRNTRNNYNITARSTQSRPSNIYNRPVNRPNNYHRPVIVNNYYNRPPRYTVGVPYYGQRFNRINHPYINIVFGGFNYQYYNGVYYRPHGNYFQVIAPPIGIHINVLPVGYYRFKWRNNQPYYYYNGVFYNQYQNYYEVIQPPMGAKLPSLPAGAKPEIINGRKYYEYAGTFYAEEYNANNEILYTVVGVHGVLDNTEVAQLPVISNNDINQIPLTVDPEQTQSVTYGIIQTLPANCKVVEENGQKYYLSPQNIYYQEVIGTDGIVSYQQANITTSPSSY